MVISCGHSKTPNGEPPTLVMSAISRNENPKTPLPSLRILYTRYTAHGTTVTTCPIPVATAAPKMPLPRYCTNNQSRNMLEANPAAIAPIAPNDALKFLRSGTHPVENICTVAKQARTKI